MTTTSATHHDHPGTPDEFDLMYDAVQTTFAARTADAGPLFRTDVADTLFDTYLNALPAHERQIATCSACRHFMRRYGHLVTIDATGAQHPAMWDPDAVGRSDAQAALAFEVRRARITGAHIATDKTWGIVHRTPNGWTHLVVHPPKNLIHRGDRAAAHARAAEITEHRGTLGRALAEFDRDLVARAVTMLDTDALDRSEKVAGPARFLLRCHDELASARGRVRENLLWRAVASAPPGFCTPRSAMVGTLLEDLASGMGQDQVARRWAAKMHPLAYQRPQAAPSAGNVAAAEKLIASLGLAASLRRRFARLDEIHTVWRPAAPATQENPVGVFGHLTTKGATARAAPEVDGGAVTWVKFAATVLPHTERIEVYLTGGLQGFYGMTTASDPDAPPILQWDREEARNPFAWYVYSGGSTAAQWGLDSGWATVDAVTTKPSQWGDRPVDHQGKAALFVIATAKDQRNNELALFPETLRSELHAIRSTVEAYSKAGRLDGEESASANGIIPAAADRVRVTTSTGRVIYLIDRWD